jgi:hypothetical protein
MKRIARGFSRLYLSDNGLLIETSWSVTRFAGGDERFTFTKARE